MFIIFPGLNFLQLNFLLYIPYFIFFNVIYCQPNSLIAKLLKFKYFKSGNIFLVRERVAKVIIYDRVYCK